MIENSVVASDQLGVPSARNAFNTLTFESAASLLHAVAPQQAPAQQTLF